MAVKASSGKSSPAKSRKKPAAKAKAAAKSVKKPTPKAQTSKLTMNVLKSEFSRLESRLKRNQTDTKKIITSLEARFADLEATTKKTSTSQKANLTRQVNRLTGKLGAITDDVRRDVEADLKSAIANPNELLAAVDRANARLDQAEVVQDTALRKVNTHLAQMARAVEASLETHSARMDQMESDTAGALTDVGEKIETLTTQLNKRRDADQLMISEKVNELSLETQTELERHKLGLEKRLDRLEVAPDTDERYERLAFQLDRVNARLESLEHDLSSISESQAELHEHLEAKPPVPAYAPRPYNEVNEAPVAAPMPLAAPAPIAVGGNIVSMQDAFSPQPLQAQPMPVHPAPEPVVARATHEPEEFNPTAYAPPQITAQAPASLSASQMAPPPATSTLVPPPPAMPAGPVTMDTPPPGNAAEYAPVDDVMPFADPAYAESADMRAQRIGGNDYGTSLKDKLSALPITGRNLRVAGMAVGVCVVGLWAGKNVLGIGQSSPSSQPLPMANAEQIMPVDQVPPQDLEGMASVDTLPAIGNYADNKAPKINASEATTLAAAADAGNPIAQFQLGLSKLQQNDVAGGVQLIRLAANKNLPAAQYRLAKLYEAGQGVEADPSMARKLTEQAARAGNRIAMHDLALYYTDGRGGVDKDISKAVGWFNQAAERGVVDSQFNLAVLSESGQGTTLSPDNAYFWYAIAAQQGDQYAKKRVDVLEAGMTPEQLAPLQKRVKAFKPKPIDEAANGIFKNVPWAAPDKNVRITQVRETQTMLSNLGYDVGKPDGSYGPRTKAAIIQFERANSMPETGKVSPALMDRMKLVGGA